MFGALSLPRGPPPYGSGQELRGPDLQSYPQVGSARDSARLEDRPIPSDPRPLRRRLAAGPQGLGLPPR